MVKSWVCPRCLGDLDAFYVEEGDTIVTDDKISARVVGTHWRARLICAVWKKPELKTRIRIDTSGRNKPHPPLARTRVIGTSAVEGKI